MADESTPTPITGQDQEDVISSRMGMTDGSTPTPTTGQPANGNQEDVVIAVMGMTGSGKSSFIKDLTQDANIIIGHDIVSETSDVQTSSLFDEKSGRRVVIVDTPGFDDSRCGMTDTVVLKKIAGFLLHEYDMNRKLNGLIYIQSIASPRFGAQAQRNLKMFRGLCGTEAYSNVVVVTTFWDEVTEQVGSRRQEQLYSTVFKDLVDGGARFMQHNRTREGALEVIGQIFTFTPKNVRIAEEIRKEGKVLEDTEAGSVRREELDHLIMQRKQEVAKLKEEANAHRDDEAMRKELEEEEEDLTKQLVQWESERTDLKKGMDFDWRLVVGGVCLLAGGAVLVPAALTVGLNVAGFTAAGMIAEGSLAATIQSVAAGTILSTCQSMAATAVPSVGALVSAGASTVTGSVLIGVAVNDEDDKPQDGINSGSEGGIKNSYENPLAAPGTGPTQDGSDRR